jgi:citrate lyase subunit beta / citryl-CoA lyase
MRRRAARHRRSGSDGPIPDVGRLTPRTLLFVPGDRPDRFDKAAAAGADGAIIDLEDSVPAQHKEQARAATAAWLARATAWVRVNPSRTDDFLVDLDRCASAPGLAGIVIPKAERTQDLDRLAERVGPAVPVIAMIESARGLLAAEAIAGHPSVQLIAFGNLDFAADCGLSVDSPDELELLPARTHLSVVARAAGIPGPIDGVTADVRNPSAAARDAARAARLGFSGKLCVHPSQVPVVHQAFAPSADQITWAQRILGAVSEGVGVVDGAMVDRPVLLRAQQILDRA